MPAPRNRTLTLTEEEKPTLRASLLTEHDIHTITPHTTGALFQANTLSLLPQLPPAIADLIILDPPYNIRKVYGQSTFQRMHHKDYLTYLRSWLPGVVRLLKPGGSLYMCGDWKCSLEQMQALEECGLTIVNRITWQRDKGRGTQRNWKNAMEDIWFAVRDPQDYYFDADAVKLKRMVRAPYRDKEGNPKDWERDGKTSGRQKAPQAYRLTHPSNFWDDISIPFWSMPENTPHPTQKPEKLMAKLILASSRPGDLVLDPFMGSGTTCVTARKLNRRYIGIEQEPDYCLFAAKRLLMANEDPRIQGYADGVFWERNSIPQPSQQ